MVERQPSKLNVVGSSPISRSNGLGKRPYSRLREKKESEIQPAWERGGTPLGATAADEQRLLLFFTPFQNEDY